MLNIVVLAPQREGCGNYVTMNRICGYFSRNGHNCHLLQLSELPSTESYRQFLEDKAVDLVIGIHAFHSGKLLITTDVPFILIFGGTDVNEFTKDVSKMAIMSTAVKKARSLVVFSRSVLAKAQDVWPDETEKMKIIMQGVLVEPSSFSLVDHLVSQDLIPRNISPKIFLCIGGIRPVKDPLFLVETFQEWHETDEDVYLVFIGPVLNSDYFQNSFIKAAKQRQGVIYLPVLPIEDVHAAMSQSCALVNSSVSEGMPLAILEAMLAGTLVLARDIPGNSSIIQDGHNGILYSSPQDFLTKTKSILSSEARKKEMMKEAKLYVEKHHCPHMEERLYISLLQQ